MSWFKKLMPKISTDIKKAVPDGIWNQCLGCQATLYQAELQRHLMVCSKCNHHHRLSARERLAFFLDPGK